MIIKILIIQVIILMIFIILVIILIIMYSLFNLDNLKLSAKKKKFYFQLWTRNITTSIVFTIQFKQYEIKNNNIENNLSF